MNLWSRGQKPAKYGLVNQGATCYLNSVLQVLFMTEDFRERVKSYKWHNTRTDYIDNELTDLFSDLEKNPAYTYKITNKLKIKNVYEQRDAAEHYEKILRLTNPEASEIFHGELINRTKCQRCNTQTESEAGFWHLPLPLVESKNDYSVEKGIEDFFRPSVISGEDQMYCEKCDEKRDAVLDCVVKHHPEVLVLLLKRFEFDYRYMTYIKINRAVNVPHTLFIPQNQPYELYAVVEHFGELRCGHYYSTIKSQDDDEWYIFDDSNIVPLNALPKMERSKSAYLLFYRKQKGSVPVVINETSETGPTEITIETEDTTGTSGEEEDKSVRAAPKRAISLNESESAENAQIKKQKQELSDQAVRLLQTATGQEYEDITEKNNEGVSDMDRQDLYIFQQTHEPDVKMHDSKQQRANNDWNQPRQSPSEVNDSLVVTQFNDCNSSPTTTKGASEHVTRGEKVQSVSQQPSGQEYDSQKLENESDTGAHKLAENISRSDSETQVCKDCVSGDRSWNNGKSPGVSGAHVNSESVDMKHVPCGEHVNRGEEDQAEMRGSLEISALQPELLSDQNCICVKNQDKNGCVEENHSDIGAHTLGQTSCKDGCEMVKSEGDVAGDTSHRRFLEDNSDDNDPSLGLSGLPVTGKDLKEWTVEIEKMDVHCGEHVSVGNEDQTGVRDSLDKKYYADKGKCQKSCNQQHQSDIGALQSEEEQRSSSIMNDIISEDGCANRYGDCMSGPALTSVTMNASARQSSMTTDTNVTSECDNIEEGMQGKEKQGDCSHTGAQTLDGLSCCCKNGCECKGDVAGDTPYRNLDDHSENSCPSLSCVPMTRNDSEECHTTTEVDKNELAGERAAEDQAGLREMSVGSEKTAQQPTSDQYEEQQGNVYKAQGPEDQSDVGDLAEIKSRGSHELMKNVTDVTSETTPDLGCVAVTIKDSVQLKDVHRDIEQTKEEEQVNEREKSSFVGVSVQGTGKTESEEASQVKSVENYDLCDNIKDQEKIKHKISAYSQEGNKKHVDVHDRKATVQKCLLTKYDLYLDSVKQYKKICQQNVSKSAQMSNKSQSEKMDRKTDEVKDSQNTATKSREYDHCTSDNSFGENRESPEQKKSGSVSWSNKESEQKERPDQLERHKTKYSKRVIREGDTETTMIILDKKQGYTQPNVRHEKNTVSNNPISSHDNKVHESDSLSEGVDSRSV